jgi:hypothetical protein
MLIARGVKAHPERAPAWRKVLELQFAKGARHGAISKGSPKAIAAVSAADLHDGWKPLYGAAGEVQRLLDLRQATANGIKAAAERRGRAQ